MTKKSLNKNIFISTILLFGIGSLLHFAYDLFNKFFIIGLFVPVNESIFEHLKLALFPILAWWIVFYLLKKNKDVLDRNKWFTGCLVSMIISIIVIVSIYYFVRYGMAKESIVIDIITLYIALLIGQFTGYHTYKYISKSNFFISIIVIVSIVIIFITLTLYPFKVPIFKDNLTNTYGIFENK